MKNSFLLWLFVFVLGAGLRTMHLFHPIDSGSWRENDVASIARNYYRGGMDFLHPQIDWRGTGPGYAEMELPVYPYMIAICYKIFGFHESAGRIISFLFSIAALLVFFRLSQRLLKPNGALIASLFFALSPILLFTSNSLQPESVMFFFYVSTAYLFVRWLDSDTWLNYILSTACLTLALLSKLTAGHIGLLLLFLIIQERNIRYLFNWKVLLMGFISLAISGVWYVYAHGLYLQYGNSLGVSNEYHWIGSDFFTNRQFILGIIMLEIKNVIMLPALFIIAAAFFVLKPFKENGFRFGLIWIVAVWVFYILACRTTSSYWAFYYHIFSVPAISILFGYSFAQFYEKYAYQKMNKLVVVSLLSVISLSQLYFFAKATKRLSPEIDTSEYYANVPQLKKLIPPHTTILVSGGNRLGKTGHPIAYNSSYFYYWLDCTGFNLCGEDQNIEKVRSFKDKGAQFFIAEKAWVATAGGFESDLRKDFSPVYESDNIILFKLTHH